MNTKVAALQYSHSIGRSDFSGPAFRDPVSLAASSEGLIYVVSHSYEFRPDGASLRRRPHHFPERNLLSDRAHMPAAGVGAATEIHHSRTIKEIPPIVRTLMGYLIRSTALGLVPRRA